ncbi:MAG: D-tyrosyl-tRNA(Tyr) deacylase [Acholeplasmataceae bacterium]|nr:D-tyrosyl-tRNA(Tyr) deacylase [Acholeplasmataceae bacterium]
MRCIVQRVNQASVKVDQNILGVILKGYLIYVGIHYNDNEENVIKMAKKIHALRIIEDENGRMNLSLSQVKGQILAISQFTLYGDTKGNNRPSFIEAAKPTKAKELYELFITELQRNYHVEQGVFGAHMEISSINDGPVNIIIEI